MIPQALENTLSIDPDIQGGALCFKGTRVPLNVFLDNLEVGLGVDEFLEHYPTVDREQVLNVIHYENALMRTKIGLPELA